MPSKIVQSDLWWCNVKRRNICVKGNVNISSSVPTSCSLTQPRIWTTVL